MIESGLPGLMGVLSRELFIICDQQYLVCEANKLALQMLGSHIVGRPFLSLLADMSRTKGQIFVEHLYRLDSGVISDSWELLFDVIDSPPVLFSTRGALYEPGKWLLVGTYESPQLTALYHKVLAMNSELTNLIRQLSKEQVRLNREVMRLLEKQEHFHG